MAEMLASLIHLSIFLRSFLFSMPLSLRRLPRSLFIPPTFAKLGTPVAADPLSSPPPPGAPLAGLPGLHRVAGGLPVKCRAMAAEMGEIIQPSFVNTIEGRSLVDLGRRGK